MCVNKSPVKKNHLYDDSVKTRLKICHFKTTVLEYVTF